MDQSEFKVLRTGSYSELAQEAPQEKPAEVVAPEPVVEQTQEAPAEVTQPETVAEPVQETPAEIPPVEVVQEQPKPKDFKEVLLENGFDDNIYEMLSYYKENGNLDQYLEVKSKNYDAMSDEEIMRHNLRDQYKSLSDAEFDLLYHSKVVDRFKLDRDVFDAEDRAAQVGLLELKLEANAAREKLKEQQSKFALPTKDLTAEAQRQQEQMQQQLAAFQNYISSHPETKKILSDKRLVIGSGDQSFNYAVTPEKIMEQVTNPDKFWEKFQKSDGHLDLANAYKTMAFSENPEAYEKALIEYGKTLATKEIVEGELHNATPVREVAAPAQQEDLWTAFKNKGVHKSFGG